MLGFLSKIGVGLVALSGGSMLGMGVYPLFAKIFGEGAGAGAVSITLGTALVGGATKWVLDGGIRNLDKELQNSFKEGLRQTLSGNENYRDQARRLEIEKLESRLNRLKHDAPKPTPGLEIERER